MKDKWEESKPIDDEAKKDKGVVELDVDVIVLKPSSFLEPPEKPVIYLSEKKTKELVQDLLNALKYAKDGIIIKINGDVNPRKEKENFDGSMFITRELKMKKDDLKLK